jgi:hypothetical protein
MIGTFLLEWVEFSPSLKRDLFAMLEKTDRAQSQFPLGITAIVTSIQPAGEELSYFFVGKVKRKDSSRQTRSMPALASYSVRRDFRRGYES